MAWLRSVSTPFLHTVSAFPVPNWRLDAVRVALEKRPEGQRRVYLGRGDAAGVGLTLAEAGELRDHLSAILVEAGADTTFWTLYSDSAPAGEPIPTGGRCHAVYPTSVTALTQSRDVTGGCATYSRRDVPDVDPITPGASPFPFPIVVGRFHSATDPAGAFRCVVSSHIRAHRGCATASRVCLPWWDHRQSARGTNAPRRASAKAPLPHAPRRAGRSRGVYPAALDRSSLN